MNVRLTDADFITAIAKLNCLIVGELHELVVKRDSGNIGIHFDGVWLAERTGNGKDAIGAAVAGQLIQMGGGNDERIEIDLVHSELPGNG